MSRTKQDLSSGVTQSRQLEALIKYMNRNDTNEDSITR